jgi:predicted membrane-bound spermidine synthase
MSAASKMGMRSYVSVVTLGSLMVSMIYPLVVLKIEGMSEAAGGAGIVWAFSVPSIVILSLIASKYTYRKYISSETIARITGLYVSLPKW